MVCVDYSDFLDITLNKNARHFDKITIATIKRDTDTQKICKKHNVDYILTNRLYENGAKFNKGKAINDALMNSSRKDWLIITDADMVMPDNLREILENKNLSEQCIYGTTRYMCPDYDNWLKYLDDKSIINKWVHQKHRKAIGVGFFQLVNGNCDFLKNSYKWYNENYGHAGRSDRIFWRQWPDKMRGKIRKASCIHLGNDEMSSNWYGRITKKFN